MTTPQLRTTTVRGNETAYLEWGAEGPLVMLLHGFPDTPRSFDELATSLAGQGFRVVAPWLRGYAPTAVPTDGQYQGGAFVADVLALREELADGTAFLLGHDIGAAIAYGAAAAQPGAWERVVTMSVPPIAVLGASMASYDQLRRSWYTFFFQHPAAETVLGLDDLAMIERLWREWSPTLDPSPYLKDVREALGTQENLTAALGWYRAGFHPEQDDPQLAKEQAALAMPTPQPWLYLHGAEDCCIGADVASAVPGAVLLEGVGHFPHLEDADRVSRLVVDFLRG
jgi:pimeloyl-ACP methyl ester carboxylesterase